VAAEGDPGVTLEDIPEDVLVRHVVPLLNELEVYSTTLVSTPLSTLGRSLTRPAGCPLARYPATPFWRLKWCFICNKPWETAEVDGIVHKGCVLDGDFLESAIPALKSATIYRFLERKFSVDGEVVFYEWQDEEEVEFDATHYEIERVSFAEIMDKVGHHVIEDSRPTQAMERILERLKENIMEIHSCFMVNLYELYECDYNNVFELYESVGGLSPHYLVDIRYAGILDGPPIDERVAEIRRYYVTRYIVENFKHTALGELEDGDLVHEMLMDTYIHVSVAVEEDHVLNNNGSGRFSRIFNQDADEIGKFTSKLYNAIAPLQRLFVGVVEDDLTTNVEMARDTVQAFWALVPIVVRMVAAEKYTRDFEERVRRFLKVHNPRALIHRLKTRGPDNFDTKS
jgi:hypothetical protein